MRIQLISSKLEFITPKLASAWLSNNPNNRPINETRVTELCQKIKNGQWHEKGGAIEIFDSGRLINGQHRLTAVFRTGIPIKVKVRIYTKAWT